MLIVQEFNRTRITPEADAPSEHLTDRTDWNGLVFIIKIICFDPLNQLDPRPILFFLVLDRPGWDKTKNKLGVLSGYQYSGVENSSLICLNMKPE